MLSRQVSPFSAAGRWAGQFDLRYPLAAIATVLFQNTGAGFAEARRKLVTKGLNGAIKMGPLTIEPQPISEGDRASVALSLPRRQGARGLPAERNAG